MTDDDRMTSGRNRRLVLLDRDGVLNVDRPTGVRGPDQLVMIPHAARAVAQLNRAGVKVALVTNQAVVGRGHINAGMLALIHTRLIAELAAVGGKLDAFYVCTDTPEKATGRRKPGPGMLLEALRDFGAEPAVTPMIGDALRDLQAAAAAGCPRVLVHTGRGRDTEAAGLPDAVRPVAVHADLAAAVTALLAGPLLAGAGG